MNTRKLKMLAIVLSFGVIVGLGFIFLTNPTEPDESLTVNDPDSEVSQVSSLAVNEEESSEEDTEPEPEPESEPEQPEVITSPPTTPPVYVQQNINKIYYDGKEITEMYTLDLESATYHKVADADAKNKILTEVGKLTVKSDSAGDSGILLNFADGTRQSIAFYEKDYITLTTLCDSNNDKTNGNIQWLTFMDTAKIKNITFDGASTKALPNGDPNFILVRTTDREAIAEIAEHLKSIESIGEVKTGSTNKNPVSVVGSYNMQIVFNTGVEYYISGIDDFSISSSDIPGKAIFYDISETAIDTIRNICEKVAISQSHQTKPIAGDVKRATIYNNDDKTSVMLASDWENQMAVKDYFDALTIMEKEKLGNPLTAFNRVEMVDYNNKKFIYDLYENGFTIQGTGVEGMEKADAYTLPDWSEFKTFIKNTTKDAYKSAYWLALMSEEKIQSVLVQEGVSVNPSTGSRPLTDIEQEIAAADLREVEVKRFIKAVNNGSNNAPIISTDEGISTVRVFFNNDIVYSVFFDSDTMTVHSSDINQSLIYELADRNTNGECFLNDFVYPTPVDADGNANPGTGKPVIYLYPEETMDISVKLDFDGVLTYTYPSLDNGWEVTATPESVITNKKDNSLHYYLFWEGNAYDEWQYDKGSVVKGEDTQEFLVKALSQMGLTPKEYNDFIVYWVPMMQDNPYNLISFSGEEYEDIAKLTITPKPDSILRVHMMFKSLDKPIEIEAQEFKEFKRDGFTVVEWGGTDIS